MRHRITSFRLLKKNCVLHQIALRRSMNESDDSAKQDLYLNFFAANICVRVPLPTGAVFLCPAILDHTPNFSPCRDRNRQFAIGLHGKAASAEGYGIKNGVVGREFDRQIGRGRTTVAGFECLHAGAGAQRQSARCLCGGARQEQRTACLVAAQSESVHFVPQVRTAQSIRARPADTPMIPQ